MVGYLVFNTVTAVSSNYPLTLGARFLAGVAAGLGWGIIPGYARLMVSDQQKGKGMALAMVEHPWRSLSGYLPELTLAKL